MSQHRGHAIVETSPQLWVYNDTRQPVPENPWRDCGHCGLSVTPQGHDGCLGTLPGVVNACCGHGVDDDAYICFDGGERYAGEHAIRLMVAMGCAGPHRSD